MIVIVRKSKRFTNTWWSLCNNYEDYLNFAKEIGVDPGIVVGRLQKENYIKYSYFNDLKTHYAIL